MTDAILIVESGAGSRPVSLPSYLDSEGEEQAAEAAHAWIKALRHLTVDGQPFRRRFTFRGDSLWWFAELYLHKQQTILQVFRTVRALERLVERERPDVIRIQSAGRLVHALAPQIARSRGVVCRDAIAQRSVWRATLRMDLRARALAAAARASRLRPRPAPAAGVPTVIAAFVHRAFWRSALDESEAESYIGPVLHALGRRCPDGVRHVGVGPIANFRARRWWHAVRPDGVASRLVPIEAFAPLTALKPSRQVWRARHQWRRALWNSPALREHARIGGCDFWSIVREELAGIALLQWPWSARAMDEAGAALDRLQPRTALTYAEAGGWGRALMLECRRRRIPSVGLQHGFIYRHWLNYRHEPDEMLPDPGHPEDAGFPRPQLTLVFDRYASAHLERAGGFPPGSIAVTGSPRLDALVKGAAGLTDDTIARTRAESGAAPPRHLALLVTKFKEAKGVLPALADAVAAVPAMQLAIKTHPAETPDAYASIAGRASNISVLPAGRPLAPLLRASRAVVTVNSTVALDAAVLGVPALVIGLPNNLSPFVEAGAMAGAGDDGIRAGLERILYDERFRDELAHGRSACLTRFGIASDGEAADRSAEAIMRLLEARR
jgi:hypothetical protein